jgi:glycosyltransferase involved in cell wall biosynthesis
MMATSDEPLISVLMTAYNAAEFLTEAIESVLQQTERDFELVIVDDASTDDTVPIIERYAARDRRVRLLRPGRLGRVRALRTGLEACRGRLVAILDADDISLRDRLRAQAEFLRVHPEIVLVGSGCELIDRDGRSIGSSTYPTSNALLQWSLEHVMPFFPHSSAMVRRDVLLRSGAYGPRCVRAMDWDMFLRVSERGRLASLPRTLVKIRKHEGGISNDQRGRLQPIMAVSATIGHLRRMRGEVDPTLLGDDEWKAFTAWVEQRLDEVGHFEGLRRWQVLGHTWATTNGGLAARVRETVRSALREPPGTLIVRWRLLGSPVPKRLARESSAFLQQTSTSTIGGAS